MSSTRAQAPNNGSLLSPNSFPVQFPVKFLVLLMVQFMVLSPLVCAGTKPSPQQGRGARESEAEQLVRRIEAHYGRMRGLAADFEQVYNGPGGRERRERGRLFLQRPGRMRWEYDPRPGKLFIVNGREVWFYSPADREAVHSRTNSIADARFPFLFLLGQANLRREFSAISFADESSDAQGARRLRLTPAREVSGLRELFLNVMPDGRIVRLALVDEAGAMSEISLNNVSENFVAPADLFEFRPPSGVNVRSQN